jgi:hypothetical protein
MVVVVVPAAIQAEQPITDKVELAVAVVAAQPH